MIGLQAPNWCGTYQFEPSVPSQQPAQISPFRRPKMYDPAKINPVTPKNKISKDMMSGNQEKDNDIDEKMLVVGFSDLSMDEQDIDDNRNNEHSVNDIIFNEGDDEKSNADTGVFTC